jgi:hypothetical protein
MAALLEIYFKKETLKTILKTIEVKNQNGFSMTLNVSDESNQYDQNVTGFATQTKEDREAKKVKFYVGNGRVIWTDGKVIKAKKNNVSDLPTPAQVKFNEHSDISPSNEIPF